MNVQQYLRNPRVGLHRVVDYLKDQAVLKGIMNGHRSYVPFIILGYFRSGTNYLQSLLNSHPQIATYFEVFFPGKIFWANGVYAAHRDETQLVEERDADPVAFLNTYLYRSYASHLQAVGFKFLYPQLEQQRFQPVTQRLVENPEVRIIHIKRKNLLKRQVSSLLAKQSGVRVSVSQRPRAFQPIQLSVAACREAFEQLTAEVERFDRLFQAHATLSVWYEDLSEIPESILNQAFAFLDVSPQPIYSPYRKIVDKRLRDLLVNYDELKAAFAGTPWENYFDE
jgi:LPS sulfotransferase NodH